MRTFKKLKNSCMYNYSLKLSPFSWKRSLWFSYVFLLKTNLFFYSYFHEKTILFTIAELNSPKISSKTEYSLFFNSPLLLLCYFEQIFSISRKSESDSVFVTFSLIIQVFSRTKQYLKNINISTVLHHI